MLSCQEKESNAICVSYNMILFLFEVWFLLCCLTNATIKGLIVFSLHQRVVFILIGQLYMKKRVATKEGTRNWDKVTPEAWCTQLTSYHRQRRPFLFACVLFFVEGERENVFSVNFYSLNIYHLWLQVLETGPLSPQTNS